jgi:hypothetical protein
MTHVIDAYNVGDFFDAQKGICDQLPSLHQSQPPLIFPVRHAEFPLEKMTKA